MQEKQKKKRSFSLSVALYSLLGIKKKDKEVEIYKKSKRLLNEYIDLKKIIDRLQDIDKLKNILLNDSQKLFFDLIPRPEISITKSAKPSSLITDKSITKTKLRTTTNKIILKNYENLISSNAGLDEKILALFDEKTLVEIGINKNGNSVRKFIILLFFRRKKLKFQFQFDEYRKKINNLKEISL